MSVCEVKLLLEGFCEQETANMDSLVLLSLQETVTSEGCSLQKCMWHQDHGIREIKAVVLQSVTPGVLEPLPCAFSTAKQSFSSVWLSAVILVSGGRVVDRTPQLR